ncbi:hypothetical protein [Streptomyces spirodelae]|uniref:Uncharacterized protein n=1 Tax=Streptomyces spirodelae TaxID=2812904 RepID=A0ABS3WLU9_9ACTN|nr:hypothetical protein [Streptomyces spirodelae]MBO8184090.1 hypothetical protein [Streptomyces spirodelae]
MVFAVGATGAFLLVNLSFLGRFARGRLSESQQMLGLKRSVDLTGGLDVVVAQFLARHTSVGRSQEEADEEG